uniref:Uncharacterized protein n=1 Tax=Aegilops tauschii subsp. strangulata TaxID=200361 RepID=A0A453GDC6_AEGTS
STRKKGSLREQGNQARKTKNGNHRMLTVNLQYMMLHGDASLAE